MLILLAGGKEMRSPVSLTSPLLAGLVGIVVCSQLNLPLTYKTGMFVGNVTPNVTPKLDCLSSQNAWEILFWSHGC